MVVITVLVYLGVTLIQNSRQMAIVATSSLVTVVILEAIQISMRVKRYRRLPVPCVITRGEQKIFQVSIIWTISVMSVMVIKWPQF
jgi:hypothetical protein